MLRVKSYSVKGKGYRLVSVLLVLIYRSSIANEGGEGGRVSIHDCGIERWDGCEASGEFKGVRRTSIRIVIIIILPSGVGRVIPCHSVSFKGIRGKN